MSPFKLYSCFINVVVSRQLEIKVYIDNKYSTQQCLQFYWCILFHSCKWRKTWPRLSTWLKILNKHYNVKIRKLIYDLEWRPFWLPALHKLVVSRILVVGCRFGTCLCLMRRKIISWRDEQQLWLIVIRGDNTGCIKCWWSKMTWTHTHTDTHKHTYYMCTYSINI